MVNMSVEMYDRKKLNMIKNKAGVENNNQYTCCLCFECCV